MIKTFKVRLEPNDKQLTMLFQCSGTARWAYNWCLANQQENYKNGGKFISDGDLRKELTLLKSTEEYKWLNKYSNNITKQAIKDGCEAYRKFFKGLSKYPRFKSKKRSKLSFYVDTAKIKFTENSVKLEKLTDSRFANKQKLNWVKLSENSRIPFGGNITYLNPRIIFDGVHWYITVGVDLSFSCEGYSNEMLDLTGESLGIDVGIKSLAVLSNSSIPPFKNINKTHKVRKLEKRLRKMQRKVSRKYDMNKQGNSYKKTKNIIKLEKSIRKLHKRLNNIRTDYIQKVTTQIVKTKPSRIVMENLNIEGMMKNRHLSRAVAIQRLYDFKRILQYKCSIYGLTFVEADRFYPSSKMCCICGSINHNLKLSDRTYTCSCGNKIDRDLNASINLSRYKLS
jgi:putative transposase